MPSPTVRERILFTASELFYAEGVHAVGIDRIIAEAGVAKSSLYSHFRTKDELIAAYAKSEDEVFWQRWESVATTTNDPRKQLTEILTWIGTKIATPGYRGCPQLNIAAEFPDPKHPAREVATHHKTELRHRLSELTRRARIPKPELVADQLWLLVDGAFANHDLVAQRNPVALLVNAGKAIMQTTKPAP